MNRIDALMHEVRLELLRAQTKHPRPHISPHEGYGVLAEEVHELFMEVISNNHVKARVEAVQVAAMACRMILEVYDRVGIGAPADAAEARPTEFDRSGFGR